MNLTNVIDLLQELGLKFKVVNNSVIVNGTVITIENSKIVADRLVFNNLDMLRYFLK